MTTTDKRRIALYNGQEFDLGDADAQEFLDMVLVPNTPDLRGAGTRITEDDTSIIFEYYKRAGEKG